MGLEIEELLMACEEEFGVHLQNHGLHNLSTVGGLYYCLLRQMEGHKLLRCPRLHVFLTLRATLIRQLGLDKGDLKSNARLAEILPQHNRRRVWKSLQDALPYPILPLDSVLSDRMIGGISILAGLPLGFLLGQFTMATCETAGLGAFGWFAAALFPFLAPACIFVALGGYLQSVLPVETFGELVDVVTAQNNWGFSPDGTAFDSASVWIHLQEIVAEHFAVEKSRIAPETDFSKDLGAG